MLKVFPAVSDTVALFPRHHHHQRPGSHASGGAPAAGEVDNAARQRVDASGERTHGPRAPHLADVPRRCYAAPDRREALRQLAEAVQVLRPHLRDEDLPVVDAGIGVLESGEPGRWRQAPAGIAGVAGVAMVIGDVGVPVVQAVRAVRNTLGVQ
ncbi:hypothetical protein [Streptomyces sp. NPDC051567]|uniref:hypothetical protein n=1 Tax=Streptomyces sp. NPDC051567 TaxID=3365660 RepID=UPI00378F3BB5